ncbi:MAG: tetratricopeptide repeat protein, partial [Acidobacteriota bacterium]
MRARPAACPHRRSPNLRWLWAVALAAASIAAGCGPSPAPLPEPPDLGAVDRSVRDQYRGLRARLDALGPGAPASERASAHGDLGLWFHAYRLPEAAELAYGNALLFEPGSPRWHYLRGVLFAQTGRPAEAAEHFEAAVDAGADSAATVRLAEVEVELGRVEAAISRLEPVAKAGEGRSVRAKVAMARGLLARPGASEADRLRAVALLEAALALQPRAPGVRYQLATLYRGLGDDANADRQLAMVAGEAKNQPADSWLRPRP